MRQKFFRITLLLAFVVNCLYSFQAKADTIEAVALNNPNLSLTYTLVNVWSTGFQASVVIHNNGVESVADWRLSFDMQSGISNIWSATIISHEGSTFNLEPVYYTKVVPAGGSINFGFIGILEQSNTISNIALIDPAFPVEDPPVDPVEPLPPMTITEPPPYLGYGPSLDPIFNYGSGLQMSWYFYEAQRSGPLPRFDGDMAFTDPRTGIQLHNGYLTNRIPWRGDSDLDDGADVGLDLTGGWHDAGDHAKFGLPMAFSASFLAWGVLEFEDGLLLTGQLERAKDNLRWVADYLIRAHAEPNVLYGQVGDGHQDHTIWGPPEIMPHVRPAYKIDLNAPGPDLAAQTSAAMTAIAMVFQNDEPLYAQTLLSRAIELYDFAQTTRAPETETDDSLGRYSDSIVEAQDFYLSRSGAKDDLPYAAAWLYLATKEPRFLHDAEADYTRIAGQYGKHGWAAVWDDVRYAVYVLMSEIYADPDYAGDTLITSDERHDGYFDYDLHAQNYLNHWLEDGGVVRTPGGLAWLFEWGSGRYTTSTSFLAMVYRKHLLTCDAAPHLQENYLKFATEQINYLLGDNPLAMSYVVGFGSNWSQVAHHRASHGSTTNNIYDPVLPRQVLYGALAGGPAFDDSYTDDRGDYMLSEPAIDSNAALTGLLAALVDAYGPAGNEADPYFPSASPAIDEFFVNATLSSSVVSPAMTRVRLDAVNESAYPPRASQGLFVRYFVDLSELYEAGYSVADVVLTVHSNEGSGLKLERWKNSAYIFYVENSFVGIEITPLGAKAKQKSVEFSVGVSSPEIPWNPENDPSFVGLMLDNAVKSGGVVLYDIELPEGEELIWGVEPPQGVLVSDLPPSGDGGGEEPLVFSSEAVVTNLWSTGYCVNFPMTNISSTPQKPLTLTFVLQAEVVISKSWNGVIVRTGDDVEVTLPTWVWTLEPGQSQTAFGYCAQGSILPEQVRAH